MKWHHGMERKGNNKKGNVTKGKEKNINQADKGSSTQRLHLAQCLGTELAPAKVPAHVVQHAKQTDYRILSNGVSCILHVYT